MKKANTKLTELHQELQELNAYLLVTPGSLDADQNNHGQSPSHVSLKTKQKPLVCPSLKLTYGKIAI